MVNIEGKAGLQQNSDFNAFGQPASLRVLPRRRHTCHRRESSEQNWSEVGL